MTEGIQTRLFAGTSLLRGQNRAGVLRELWENPGLSRVDLANNLGIAKSTVSIVVGELIEEKLVSESSEVQPGIGRPPRLLNLDAEFARVISWQIEVEYLSVVFLDFFGNVQRQEKTPRKENKGVLECLDSLATMTKKLMSTQRKDTRWLGLCLAVPGLVEPTLGHLTLAPNLGWRDMPLQEYLEACIERYKFPLETKPQLENEANAAALASYFFDYFSENNLVYISLGVGVGSGLVVAGHLYVGAYGHAGEIGHISLDRNGDVCKCGQRGCAENYLSVNKLRASKNQKTEDEMAERLAQLIGIMVSTLDPKIVVLGGELLRESSESFFENVLERVPKYSIEEPIPLVKIIRSKLDNFEAAKGATVSVINSFIEGQTRKDRGGKHELSSK